MCGPETELLAVDVTIEGRTDAHTDLRGRRRELEQIELTDGGTTVRVVDVTVDAKPRSISLIAPAMMIRSGTWPGFCAHSRVTNRWAPTGTSLKLRI